MHEWTETFKGILCTALYVNLFDTLKGVKIYRRTVERHAHQ